MSVALAIIATVFIVAIGLGLAARRGHDMNLEQWTVGGRGFGAIFVFLLMAGEIYTTFTFLGGSGWAYGKGAPAFYILCYGAIAYTFSYFLLPAIWRYAQPRKFVSQADFFVSKYDSRTLGLIVTLVGVIALIPYLVLQLKGLGIIVSEASYGSISPAAAVWAGTVALIAYVVVSGVRGSAWTAALKDVMILVVVVAIGIYLPLHYHGGFGEMFRGIERTKPGFLTLAPSGMSSAWFISTVALTATGFYMWPQYFSSVYTARSDDVFHKNAVMLPLYQLVILFVFFAGFAALLVVPGLQGTDADLSLLRISKQAFSPTVVGLIGAAGLLTALVPGSMILITAATLLAQGIARVTSRETSSFVARALVPVLALASAIGALRGGQALVALLLMGYSVVTQLFPALIFCLGPRPRISAAAAIAGIVAGELTVGIVTLSGASITTIFPSAPQAIKDVNVGVVALAVNVVVAGLVALATRHRAPANVAELQTTVVQ